MQLELGGLGKNKLDKFNDKDQTVLRHASPH